MFDFNLRDVSLVADGTLFRLRFNDGSWLLAEADITSKEAEVCSQPYFVVRKLV